MLKLIINADDFGYSRAVNYGIIDAHTEGILTSTTLMTNMPGAMHAYELGKIYTKLGIGIHLTLTCGKPILKSHHTLVDVNGNFKKLHNYQGVFHIEQEELYLEWKAQINAFLNSGLIPTHLDSHHHINNIDKRINEVFLQLADKYKLPVRNNFNQSDTQINFVTTDKFEYNPEILLKKPTILLDKYKESKSLEIMCHPAYLDKSIMENSSYAFPRIEELEMLTNPAINKSLKSNKFIQLVTYRDLKDE